jgi:hypothetical protein
MKLRFLCSLFFLVACTGGSSDQPSSDGGASSSSSSSSGSSSSSSGSTVATPQVVFEGRFEQGGDGGASCNDVGKLAGIGAFGDSTALPPTPSTPVKDNAQVDGRAVRVTCTVKRSAASPDAFDVEGSIVHPTLGFAVSGVFKPSGEQVDIFARFTGDIGEGLVRPRCTARYTTSFQGVSAGRVWAEVDCLSEDGACRALAQFRFENCVQ